jgi:hypothetical protein
VVVLDSLDAASGFPLTANIIFPWVSPTLAYIGSNILEYLTNKSLKDEGHDGPF